MSANDMEIREVYRALGSLTSEVQGLRRDIDVSVKGAQNFSLAVDQLVSRLTFLEFHTQAVKKIIDDEVRPVVYKVNVWEQRGMTLIAAAGLVGTTLGFLISTFWRDAMAWFNRS